MNEKFYDLTKEKQDRIINAALSIFAREGYRRASTDDMVRKAGISKGLLFHYFGSKLSLYGFIYDYSVKYMQFELTHAIDPGERDLFELRRQEELAKVRVQKNYPAMQWFLNRASREDDPDALAEAAQAREQYLKLKEGLRSQADLSVFLSPEMAERVRHILDYTIEGLLADACEAGEFDPQRYYTQVCDYLRLLRRML